MNIPPSGLAVLDPEGVDGTRAAIAEGSCTQSKRVSESAGRAPRLLDVEDHDGAIERAGDDARVVEAQSRAARHHRRLQDGTLLLRRRPHARQAVGRGGWHGALLTTYYLLLTTYYSLLTSVRRSHILTRESKPLETTYG
eukprot:scaffold104548_cov60-Phaeocystis_antarctica.AAC.3